MVCRVWRGVYRSESGVQWHPRQSRSRPGRTPHNVPSSDPPLPLRIRRGHCDRGVHCTDCACADAHPKESPRRGCSALRSHKLSSAPLSCSCIELQIGSGREKGGLSRLTSWSAPWIEYSLPSKLRLDRARGLDVARSRCEPVRRKCSSAASPSSLVRWIKTSLLRMRSKPPKCGGSGSLTMSWCVNDACTFDSRARRRISADAACLRTSCGTMSIPWYTIKRVSPVASRYSRQKVGIHTRSPQGASRMKSG
mmetsp:Transcript_26436/g.89172  ORF Transcript_26436/g.89172 Transcript_26436/m.89172 type:complete len:252 (+) Transcript_26436:89-844(+)